MDESLETVLTELKKLKKEVKALKKELAKKPQIVYLPNYIYTNTWTYPTVYGPSLLNGQTSYIITCSDSTQTIS